MFKNLKFPLQIDKSLGMFQITETTIETIKQNLILFFATDENERVVNNQLGSRFRKYLFEPDIQNIRSKCENDVNRIFSDYFPNLNLVNLEVKEIDNNSQTQNAIQISIIYSIKNLESLQDNFSIIVG